MANVMRKTSGLFPYQDTLRAVGAWLDVRGYREVRIVEDGETLVVEASPGPAAASAPVEVLRFDAKRMLRLREAARNDRGAPRVWSSRQPTDSTAGSAAPAERKSPIAVR
jgi:hypothetical protein